MNKKNGGTWKQPISLTQDLEDRWEANLSLFFHHTSVYNVKYNKGTKVKIKLQQLPSSTNKHEKGFLCLGRIQASSLLSQSTQQRKLCSCQNTWVTVRPPLHSPSQTVTPWPLLCSIQSSFCCRLISERCLEDMQWKLNSKSKKHLLSSGM